MKDGDWLLLAFAYLCLFVGGLIADVRQGREFRRLEQRIECLEHPHGESSIAATRINGRFVVTQPAHRTGCP